jgi:hypothetical protein
MSIKTIKNKAVGFILILLFIFLTAFPASAAEPDWHKKLKQIKALKSKRKDVEKIFNFPRVEESLKNKALEFVSYQTAEGRMVVRYSTGKCGAEKTEGYDLENGTVTNIIFFPEKFVEFSKLRIYRKKLLKPRLEDNSPKRYVNEDTGVKYAVKEGFVTFVEFSLPSRHDYLKCKDWTPFNT